MRSKLFGALMVVPVLFLMAVGPASALGDSVLLHNKGRATFLGTLVNVTGNMHFNAGNGEVDCGRIEYPAEVEENEHDPLVMSGTGPSSSTTECSGPYNGGGLSYVRNAEIPGQFRLFANQTGEMPIKFEIEYPGSLETYCQVEGTVPLEPLSNQSLPSSIVEADSYWAEVVSGWGCGGYQGHYPVASGSFEISYPDETLGELSIVP